MAYDIAGLGRLRVFQHTAVPYSTANIDTSASIASYRDLRFLEARPQTNVAMLADERVVQRMYERTLDVLGNRSGGLQIQSHLCTLGTALTTAATSTKTTQSLVLETLAGGYSSASGSTVQTSSTATSLIVATGHGSRFPVGSVIGVQYTGTVQIAVVTAVSVDTLTVSGLSGSPTVGNAVYNAQAIFPTDDPLNSLSCVLERPDRDNIWWMFGGQGTLEINIAQGQIPTWSTTLRFAEWKNDADAASGGIGGSALGSATYDGGAPPSVINGSLLWGDSGSALTSQHFSAMQFTTGVTFEPVPSIDGVNGVHIWRARRAEPPTVTFTIPFTDETYWTKRAARTLQSARLRYGDTAGAITAINFPSLQITDVQNEDSAGLQGVKVTAKCLENQNSTATELARAPWVLAQL